MRTRALAAGALLATLAAASLTDDAHGEDPGSQEAHAAEGRAPGPPRGVGGLAGFSTVSSVDAEELGPEPAKLETVYLFPDRARWRLVDAAGEGGRMWYRSGERTWEVELGRATPTPHAVPQTDRTILWIELRRAALGWPLGFEWSRASETAADGTLVADVHRSQLPDAARVGRLEAKLDEAGLPRTLVARDVEGDRVETLRIRSWRRDLDRDWPAVLERARPGRPAWTERVESVETRVHFLDSFFVPRARGSDPGATAREHAVLALDLPAITFREHELPLGTEWPEALRLSRTWIAEAVREVSPLAVDPVPCLELDPRGAPLRCLVRLEAGGGEPPDGWDRREASPGVGTVLGRLAELGPRPLAALRRALARSATAGTPYARILREEGPLGIQVYLPWGRPEDGPLRHR